MLSLLEQATIPLADLDEAITHAKTTLTNCDERFKDAVEYFIDELQSLRDLEALIQ